MSANLRLSVIAAAAVLLTTSGGAVMTPLSDFGGNWILGAVAAESGGHTGGEKDTGGGHTGGKGGEKDTGGGHSGGEKDTGGGHSGGKGGGHSGGGEVPGAENKGHGLKKGHEGHAAGEHGGGSTEHDVGGRRFTGGHGASSTALVPEGVGRYGSPQFRDAFRYWGGRSLADGPTDPTDPTDPTGTTDPTKTTDPTSVATTDLVPSGAGGGASVNVRTTLASAGRCDDMDSGSMTAGQRFSGANVNRIASAQALLDPSATMENPGANPHLLATFQQEMLQSSPDLTTAGLYVALVAKGPVSADKVKSVGARLCVPVSNAQAEQIAQAAENQRVALK